MSMLCIVYTVVQRSEGASRCSDIHITFMRKVELFKPLWVIGDFGQSKT
jgi:hypothetical protein